MSFFKKLLKVGTFSLVSDLLALNKEEKKDRVVVPAATEQLTAEDAKKQREKRRRSLLSEEEGGFMSEGPIYKSSLLSKD